MDILNEILTDTISKLTEISILEDNMTTVAITIEILSIMKRLCSIDIEILYTIKNKKIFSNIIDLISVNNSLILKTLLDFLYFFFEIIRKPEFEDSFYFI